MLYFGGRYPKIHGDDDGDGGDDDAIFHWPGMARMVRMVRIGTLSLANRVLIKLFLEP